MDKKKRIPKKTRIVRFAEAKDELLRWHTLRGRHELPWRRSNDPYHVLVSEFMLQQTTVVTVTPRFEAWMKLFPTLADLASSKEASVLAAWQGLGYYSRARRLHAASRAILERHGGMIPNSKTELLTLPGIGDYTASAILAFAYDQPAIVLDTNIARVIARWSNLTVPIDTVAGKTALSERARRFFDPSGSRAIASAMMDLGASLCTARHPRCTECPLNTTCKASSPEALPKKSPRAVTTKRTEHRVWIIRKGRLFLQLSEGPLWRGLWILPELATTPSGRCVAQVTYPITRYRVTMKLYPMRASSQLALRGFLPDELELIAIPSPHRRAIAAAGLPSHTLASDGNH